MILNLFMTSSFLYKLKKIVRFLLYCRTIYITEYMIAFSNALLRLE